MITFTYTGYEELAPQGTKGLLKTGRYPNGELWLKLENAVQNEHCVITGNISPPESNLLTMTLLSDTLKQYGAQEVTAYLPYMAYSRQDKAKNGQSQGFLWAVRTLEAAGVNKIITVDIHNPAIAKQSLLPIESAGINAVFEGHIKSLPADCMVVAPDVGAAARAKLLSKALNLPPPTVMHKIRDASSVKHTAIARKITKNILIVDDIIDTGSTLVSCCRQLRDQGAESFTIAVTHGLFTGDYWQALWDLGVRLIYVSNSIPVATTLKDPRIIICPIKPPQL